MLSTILVGVDGRSGSDDAVALARRLSQIDDGSIVAVAAYPATAVTVTQAAWGGVRSRADAEHALHRARSHLGEAENVTFRTHPAALPAEALVLAAEYENADVVVVGSTDRSLPGRVLGGSIVAELVRRSPCPVAVAPRGYAEEPVRDLDTVGVAVATDGSSDDAIRFAAGIAHGLEEEPERIQLICVDDVPLPERRPDGSLYPPAEARRMEIEQALTRAAEALPYEVAAEEVRAYGRPEETLTAMSGDLDLLVVGSNARGRLARLVRGRVSVAVAGAAACRVVIVPVARVRAAA